jgi:group I intron endonuclease
MTSGVYVITNTKDGKRYVGVSRDIDSRWYAHRNDLKRGKHGSASLQQAWNEYGEGAFVFAVLEECDWSEFSHKEPMYIKSFRSNESEYGYNTMFREEMKYSRPRKRDDIKARVDDDDIDSTALDRIEAKISLLSTMLESMLASAAAMTATASQLRKMPAFSVSVDVDPNDMEKLLQAVKSK